jgi:DNA repair exonuclease SbcCD ATPase subunit
MTILGKVLLFFVMVLSVVWAGLTVNVYVTRTNWANSAQKWQDKAKEAEQSAGFQRKQAEATRDAAAARVTNMQRQIDEFRTQVDTLTKEFAAAKQQLGDKLTAQQVAVPPDQLLQANIARLQKQVDILQGSLSDMEGKLNVATIGAEKSKADALRATIDRDAALKARDELENRLLGLNDQYNELKSGRSQASRTAPPDGFKATVTGVNGDTIEISLGANAKLQKNAVLSVWRPGKYVGSMTVTSVDPYGAVGRFSPPAGTRMVGENVPKVGDTVSVLP